MFYDHFSARSLLAKLGRDIRMPKRKVTRSVPPRKKSLPARFLQSVEEAVLSEGPQTPKKSQSRRGQRDSRQHTGQYQPEDDEAAQSSHHSPIVSESVTVPLATGLPGFSITEPHRPNRVTPPQVGQVIVPLATGLPVLTHRDPVVSPLSSSTVSGSGPGFVPSTTGLSGLNPADTVCLLKFNISFRHCYGHIGDSILRIQPLW